MAPTNSTTAFNATWESWESWPAEIRLMVLEALLQDGCSLAALATVSRDWQTVIERHNFARIKVTPTRLADFGSMLRRNRPLVSYIWLCLEIEEYDCTSCASEDRAGVLSNEDNDLILAAFEKLFSALSKWEPMGELMLDISVYSPSDSKHWFKYLTFLPDTHQEDCSQAIATQQAATVSVDDHQHGWVNGRRTLALMEDAIDKTFEQIMDPGLEDNVWPWHHLSSVPAITSVLLRQQNRRRWIPETLGEIFLHLPGLREIHYEPWREWYRSLQHDTDESHNTVVWSLILSNSIRRLLIFENFNQQYPSSYTDSEPIRTASHDPSGVVRLLSLQLEHLSASFMVDASPFFCTGQRLEEWPRLISLTLTSQLLTPDEDPTDINNLLQHVAVAALRMPKLETMEIWNGREGLAMLFGYRSIGSGRPAVITLRGTFALALEPSVIRA